MSSEVGSGQVAIFPVFKGFRKAVAAEVDGATDDGSNRFQKGFNRAGKDSGKSTGEGFKKAFATSTSDFSSAALKTLQKDVASASKALSTARLKEQDAAGKVRVAEAALTDARAKGTAGSARVVAAEERLASAHRNLGAMQNTVKDSTERLITSQLKLATTARAAEAASSSSGRGFMNLFATIRNSGGFQSVTNVVGGLTRAVGNGLVSALATAARAAVTTAKVGIGAFTGLVALVAGLSVKGGITRLLNIEDAQAKLKGLGNSTSTVAEIMNDALSSVKGTFFTLDDAATIAASAVAAGVKPGIQLTKYLKLTADAATIAGIPLSEMGSILNKATTSGKVYTDTLNQLADRGIPIFQYLAKVYGVTQAKLRDMVQAGEVDSEHLQRALEENIGGAALAAGDTTRGAFANMKAAMSRTGAALMSEILPKFQGFFTKVGEFFDTITPQAAAFGKKLSGPIDTFLNGALRVLKALGDISKMDGGFSFKNIRTQFEGAFPGLDGVFNVLASLQPILPALAKAFTKVAPALERVIPQLADLAVKILPVLAELIPVATDALGGLADVASNFTLPTVKFAVDPKMWDDFWNFGDPEAEGRMTTRMQSGVYGPVLAQLGSFTADWDTGWDNFWAGVGNTASNGAKQIGDFFGGIWSGAAKAIGFIQTLPAQAILALGKLGATFVNSGKDLIQGFIDGITSKFEAVRKSVTKIMDFVKSFFPHSPAERGPFSGSGWTAIGKSGGAIIDQFNKGFPDENLRLAATVGTSVAGSPARAAGYAAAPIYIQNPFTGEYLLAQVSNVASRVVDSRDRSDEMTIVGGVR